LRTLAATEGVADIVIYASSDEIMRNVEPGVRCRYVARPSWLDTDEATPEDWVRSFLSDVQCDVVVLLHITSPFITKTTVEECLRAVTSREHASAFAALKIHRFAWFRGSPLNYSPGEPTPRTQDLEPVVVEQSGLYVFTRELFESTGRRVADKPYVRIVDAFEGHDIDTEEEFALAEMILQINS
jgi:CMP-N-acetylneuraminic acid synthetase